MITLPGLIDSHVHFRTPGQTHKEDFITGTKAAIAGGFTTVIDMPNNLEPIITFDRLQQKKKIAKKQILCDVGFHFGSLGDNLEEFAKVKKEVFGLKLFLNQTTGNFIIDKKSLLKIYDAWSKSLPILVHAEEDVIDLVIKVCQQTKKKTHICHVSSKEELQKIIKAKKKGIKITCGLTPHHLFLTEEDVRKLKSYGMMKPTLKTKAD
ncbi:MAG: amidohydrolase family protein, partial [Patescibacteria group bacterium]